MTRPTVSVVVVSYQTRALTVDALVALREACSGVPYELIVVDNASTDGSAAAVARAVPAARVIGLPANIGFGNAVNLGASYASGRWLLLLNPDTRPVGDVIAALVRFAAAHPGHAVYTGRTLHHDGSDDNRSCLGLPSLWGYACFAIGLSTVLRRVRWGNPDELPTLDRTRTARIPAASGCLMLVDRALFTSLGGFYPDYFMYSEDVDLCVRATAAGATPVLVPEAAVVHAGGASSTSVAKRVMVLRGKCTYLRLHWTRRRAAAGRTLLLTGVALRAAGSRLCGRARYWREVWAQRGVWSAGWPPVARPATLPSGVDRQEQFHPVTGGGQD